MKRERNRQSNRPTQGKTSQEAGAIGYTDDIQREQEEASKHATGLLSTLGSHPTPRRTTRARACPSPRDTHQQIQTGQHPEEEGLGRQTKEVTTQETLLFSFFFLGNSCPNSFPKSQAGVGALMTIHASTGLLP